MKVRQMNKNDFIKLLNNKGFIFARRAKGDHNLYINKELNIKFIVPNHRVIKSGIVWNFYRTIKSSSI